MNIFKAYDIRGIYDKELNLDITKKIGVAFQKLLKTKEIVIGYDCRLSSIPIKNAFTSNLNHKIIDIGQVSTPLFYYVVANYNKKAGAMITASHLEAKYNGIKLVKKIAFPLTYETGIKEIEKLTKKIKLKKAKPRIIKKSFIDNYIKWVTKNIKLKKELKVIIDCGNGVMGPIATKAFKKVNCKVISCLYCNPNGKFPNHTPNPLLNDTLKKLQKEVNLKKADLGIAFDGDGDRLRIVNNKGKIIDNDIINAIFSRYYLENNPKNKIVYCINSSNIFKEYIDENEGFAILAKVGHSYIKQKMIQNKAIFGGEYSGHFYFKDTFYHDDALYAALKFLEIYSEQELNNEINYLSNKYYTIPELRINIKNKDLIIKKLENKFKNYKTSKLDGIKIYFEKGWALVRSSHTEDILSIRIEAINKKEFEKIKKLIIKNVRN